jgi:predicted LPLAT superfamily acyltransferase
MYVTENGTSLGVRVVLGVGDAILLEELCRAAPCNWFNFHDMWEPRPLVGNER